MGFSQNRFYCSLVLACVACRCNLTPVSNVCEAAPKSLFWAPQTDSMKFKINPPTKYVDLCFQKHNIQSSIGIEFSLINKFLCFSKQVQVSTAGAFFLKVIVLAAVKMKLILMLKLFVVCRVNLYCDHICRHVKDTSAPTILIQFLRSHLIQETLW